MCSMDRAPFPVFLSNAAPALGWGKAHTFSPRGSTWLSHLYRGLEGGSAPNLLSQQMFSENLLWVRLSWLCVSKHSI